MVVDRFRAIGQNHQRFSRISELDAQGMNVGGFLGHVHGCLDGDLVDIVQHFGQLAPFSP